MANIFFGFFFYWKPGAIFDKRDFSFVCILSEMKCLIIANKRSVNIVDHFFYTLDFAVYIVFKTYSPWSLKTNKQYKKITQYQNIKNLFCSLYNKLCCHGTFLWKFFLFSTHDTCLFLTNITGGIVKSLNITWTMMLKVCISSKLWILISKFLIGEYFN